ncbi:ATP-binding cassette domain-containing protein [Mesomycoplasma hyorhinis]|uniref:ATP-binding cassette domain-containing protein n=9 Tax=Mesomycoplasma hyorhinis TaxID=2100 RepID=UPI001C052D95
MNQPPKHFWFIIWNWINVIFTIAFKVFSIISPYFIFYYIINENWFFLLFWSISYFLASLILWFFDTINTAYFKGFLIHHKMKLFRQFQSFLLKVTFKDYNEKSPGYYYSQINNTTETIISNFYSELFKIIKIISIIGITLGIIFYFSWKLGLVTILILSIFFLYTSFLSKKLTTLLETKLKKQSEFNSSLSDFLKNLPTLYVLNKTNKLEDVIDIRYQSLLKYEKKYSKLSNFISFVNKNTSKLFSFLFTISIVVFSLWDSHNNLDDEVIIFANISLVALVQLCFDTFFSDIEELFDSFPNLIASWRNIKSFKQDLVFKVENSEDQLQDLEETFSLISIKNLNYKLEDRVLFNNLNLEIQKGKKYLLKGANGSGKSTFSRILLGIEKKFEGEILINNKYDIKTINPDSINNHINYVYNNSDLINASTLENITLLEQQPKEEIFPILEKINYQNLELDKTIESDLDNFSTGQTQKIHLARSLYKPKEILIIDEGLSNLDQDNFDKIVPNLLSDKNLTIIFITHHFDSNFVSKFDQIISLD